MSPFTETAKKLFGGFWPVRTITPASIHTGVTAMDVEGARPVLLQVFIVGTPRSGTSILFYAISKVL